jgi:O-antigen/teichoic acid export membrane protein
MPDPAPLPSGRKRLVSDGIWVAAGQFGVAAGLLIGTRILTELLPPAVFGMVSLLIGASTLGATLLCTPLLQALLRFYPDAVQARRIGALRRDVLVPLSRGTAVLVVLLLATGLVYSQWRDVPFRAFLVLAGLALVDVMRNFELALLGAARRQRTTAIWLAADTWARILLAIGAVKVLGLTAQAVLLGYFAGSILTFVVARAFVRREGADDLAGTDANDDHPLRREVYQYALPLVPLALVGWVSSLSDRYVVAGLLGLEEAGIYAAAYGLLNRPVAVGASIFLTTLRPIYFQHAASGAIEKEQRLLNQWLLSLGAALSFGVGFVFLFRRQIAGLLLGPAYQSTADLLPWLAFGFALLALSQVYNMVSLARKKSWAVSLSELAGALSSIAATIPLTRAYGLRGTALAVPIYYGVQLIAAWVLSERAKLSTVPVSLPDARAD